MIGCSDVLGPAYTALLSRYVVKYLLRWDLDNLIRERHILGLRLRAGLVYYSYNPYPNLTHKGLKATQELRWTDCGVSTKQCSL